MTNIEKVKADVAKVNELLDVFYIKGRDYYFEGDLTGENCLEFNEQDHKIVADFKLPYALGDYLDVFDTVADFVADLTKTIEEIDVDEIAKENCYDLLNEAENYDTVDFPSFDKEVAEVTDIKCQLLKFCKELNSVVKTL